MGVDSVQQNTGESEHVGRPLFTLVPPWPPPSPLALKLHTHDLVELSFFTHLENLANCKVMESSLASLFMESNLPCLPLSWATSGESVEELQQQLTSTSLELQSAREGARLQSRINEAKICRLQSLLDVARKERDEARTKCSKLRECFIQLSRSPQVPVPAAESPSSFFPSSISSTSSPMLISRPPSPTMDTMDFQDVKPKDIFTFENNADPSSITTGDSQQQFSMDILNEDLSLDGDESLDLIDLQLQHSPRSASEPNTSSKSSWGVHASDDSSAENTLLRQSSCISSAGSQPLGGVEPLRVPTTLYNKSVTMPGPLFPMQSSVSPSLTISNPRAAIPEVSRFANQSTPMQLKAARVEPCEHEASTLQEDALPEKGKLLQAVMQAGPLLQNLLLAGPLPQWRYPPPQLSVVDIPKVPMVPASMSHTYSSSSLASIRNPALSIHPNLLLNYPMPSAHISVPQFADERVLGRSSALPSTIASNSGRNACYGGRKLRRLSPIGVK